MKKTIIVPKAVRQLKSRQRMMLYWTHEVGAYVLRVRTCFISAEGTHSRLVYRTPEYERAMALAVWLTKHGCEDSALSLANVYAKAKGLIP